VGARLDTVVIDATDRDLVASFWARVLGWDSRADEDGDLVVSDPSGDAGVALLVLAASEPKALKNRLHLDLTPEGADQDEELERLLSLGARRIDIGQGERSWIVLADPEGNEFCLLQPPLQRSE
jgi:hypothetical protein